MAHASQSESESNAQSMEVPERGFDNTRGRLDKGGSDKDISK